MKSMFASPIPEISLTESLAFSHVYQPIFSMQDCALYGFESLIRGNNIKNPQVLFAAAEKQNQFFDLDITSICQSIFSFQNGNPGQHGNAILTVNIFPSTMLAPSFLSLIDELINKISIPPNRIIFELNEAETFLNLIRLKEIIQCLKKMGFLIALDDLGKGHSSLKVAFELEPDMVKLDQYFCIDLENSINKQRFLEKITNFLKEEGVLVTLEGIETELQFLIAKQTGVHLGQGYYLGRPGPLLGK